MQVLKRAQITEEEANEIMFTWRIFGFQLKAAYKGIGLSYANQNGHLYTVCHELNNVIELNRYRTWSNFSTPMINEFIRFVEKKITKERWKEGWRL